MNKYKIFSGFIALIVVIVGFGIHMNLIKLPFERTVEVSLPEGFNTDRGFVGLSHNIFVGKVVKNIGQISGVIPETRFQIQVVLNIKGNLPEKIIVNQEGGYEEGILLRMEDSPSLLQEGSTYLLAARTDGKGRYVVFFYPRGTMVLSSDSALSIDALHALAVGNKDVLALQEAYKTEILSNADVQHQKAFNNYQKTVTDPVVPIPPQTWN